MGGSAAAALCGLGAAPMARAASRPTKLVVVFVEGGWDVTMSFAPRLDHDFIEGPRVDERPEVADDVEVLGSYGDIRVALNDCRVTLGNESYVKRPNARLFMDKWSSECCVVNGIWTGAVGHDTSTIRMQTGTQHNTNADLCAIVGHEFGADVPLGYVAIAGVPFVGPYAASSGQFGFNSQLKLLFDKGLSMPAPVGLNLDYPLYAQSGADEDAVQRFLRDRGDRWRDIRGDGSENSRRIDDLFESYDRSERFMEAAADQLSGLTLGEVPSFAQQGRLAAEFLAGDICKAVLLASTPGWDTHNDNAVQHGFYNTLFAGLDALMTTLQDRGILDETLVVVVSEMTRTPRINANRGKDHWPHATALLMGSGVRSRASLGGYSELMESLPVSLETGEPSEAGELMRYDNFAAGLLEHLDIDPGKYLPSVAPMRGFVA